MLFNQVLTKLLEKLRVPLNDSLLLLSTLTLHFVVLFLESVEYFCKLIPVRKDLDDCAQESTIDVFD